VHIKPYIDNNEAVSKKIKLRKIFNSSLPIVIGENLKRNISDLYISNKSGHN